MTDLKVEEVNVHIQGIVTEKEAQTVDPDNLFDEESNGEE